MRAGWVVTLFSAFGEIVFVCSLPACSRSKEGGLDRDGWAGGVRTHEMTESKSVALPLGYYPLFKREGGRLSLTSTVLSMKKTYNQLVNSIDNPQVTRKKCHASIISNHVFDIWCLSILIKTKEFITKAIKSTHITIRIKRFMYICYLSNFKLLYNVKRKWFRF